MLLKMLLLSGEKCAHKNMDINAYFIHGNYV